MGTGSDEAGYLGGVLGKDRGDEVLIRELGNRARRERLEIEFVLPGADLQCRRLLQTRAGFDRQQEPFVAEQTPWDPTTKYSQRRVIGLIRTPSILPSDSESSVQTLKSDR